jgi:hypothetical protein
MDEQKCPPEVYLLRAAYLVLAKAIGETERLRATDSTTIEYATALDKEDRARVSVLRAESALLEMRDYRAMRAYLDRK